MTDRSHSQVTPSLDVIASIRHAETDASVPDELVPFVVPVYVDEDRLDDWQLTNDALAFGEPTVVRTFDAWRSGWTKSLTLDSIAHLDCLVDLAGVLPGQADQPVVTILDRMLDDVRDGRSMTITVAQAAELATSVDRLRDAVRERGSTGFGFVNATPGYTGEGLARTWSPSCGHEVIAADRHIEVSMDPETGLGVDVVGGERASAVSLVEVAEDFVHVHHVDRTGALAVLQLDPDRARPLAWMLPNATKWRVVDVPEVLVWARTFARLVECCEFAVDVDRPLTFAVEVSRFSDAPTRS